MGFKDILVTCQAESNFVPSLGQALFPLLTLGALLQGN